MELISRQAAIDTVMECYDNDELFEVYEWKLNELPPIQPEIIYCKDCKHYKYGMCMKICANKSTNGFCDWGEKREVTE